MKVDLKKTKIVATIGPASESKATLKKLFEVGVDVFRFNFSHGTHEWHKNAMDRVRELKSTCAIMLDTKGPEIRTGEVQGKFSVKVGDKFTMTIKQGVYEKTKKLSVNYPEFIKDVSVGDVIVIDSGVCLAKALKKSKEDIEFEVIEGHADITTKRHINLMGKHVSLPTITKKDWEDIDFGIKQKVDFFALSFVRNAKDIEEVRKYCEKKKANIQIISKIENVEAVDNIEEIIQASDGIMVARGDLACEISFAKVPTIQKQIVNLCNLYNKPVIIATQMVLSMVENIQPTRAEVSDVGNAIYEGADAIMTSDETTKSPHPVHVIETMARIARETEEEIYIGCGCECEECCCDTKENKKTKNKKDDSCDCYCNNSIMDILSLSEGGCCDFDAICVLCNSGNSEYVRNMSALRVSTPIYAFTSDETLANQMTLIWNTQPIFDKNIDKKGLSVVEATMKKQGVKKYLLVADFVEGKNIYPTVQIRHI